MNLSHLSKTELWETSFTLAKAERAAMLKLLHYLREIERRKLYSERGFSSMFAFVTEALGYSESAAFRRIEAMRLIRDVPEVEAKMATGTINLSTASQVRRALKDDKTIDALGLIERVEGKSSAEVRKEILKICPHAIPLEKVRELTEDKTEIRIVIDNELKATLDELKAFLSHKNPNMSYTDLIREMANEFKKLKYKNRGSKIKSGEAVRGMSPNNEKATSATEEVKLHSIGQECSTSEPETDPTPAKKSEISAINNPSVEKPKITSAENVNVKNSRYISAAVRRFVFQRDQGRCQYFDPLTKRKCNSNHMIELDHIRPFALGGTHDVHNLRLLCRHHNQYRADVTFRQPRSNEARQ